MRFAHMADLHIGKKLGAFDLIEDQRFVLRQAADLIEGQQVNAIFLAGDIYDRSVPAAEAMGLADEFLTRLADIAPVFIVPGNHDSAERLAFGRRLMQTRGVTIAGPYAGQMEIYPFRDEFGPIAISLLPFVRPRECEPFFENADFDSADKAVRAIIERDPPRSGQRNILITHQYVTSDFERPVLSDSEVIPAGGLSEVNVDTLRGYDFVALGHLHAPQKVGRDSVRYAGSPLKYSFSEVRHKKSLVIGEMDAQGGVRINLLPLPCLRDLRAIRGPLARLIDPFLVASENCADYLSITLTDEVPPAAPMDALGAVYSHIVHLELPLRSSAAINGASGADVKSPMELFSEFYRLVTGTELSGEMARICAETMAAAQEGAEK